MNAWLRSLVFILLAIFGCGFGYESQWPHAETLRNRAQKPVPPRQPNPAELRRQWESEFQASGGRDAVANFISCQIGEALKRDMSGAYWQYPFVNGKYVRRNSVLIAPRADVYCLADADRSYSCFERDGGFVGVASIPRLFPLCDRDSRW